MFGSLKIAMVAILITGIAGAGMYVMKLRSDNAILEANKKFNDLVNALKKDIDDLDNRFNKDGRDFGKLAIEKTDSLQRIINSASDKVLRCVEIAGGAPLTEQELNATIKSEINRECPSIANPNYVPYNN